MNESRYARQSFLGEDAQQKISDCIVGIVGLGGGGSHIVQQLAHIGFKHYVIYDFDIVEDTNLNRLIGARVTDVVNHTPKLRVAETMILGLQPDAVVEGHACRWQENPEPLKRCHLVFGCVDSFQERDELEKVTRRYLINYIDIGMDVTVGSDDQSIMGGQVIASLPGYPCMWCMGFLNEKNIGQEALAYGAVGGRPQVVWPNGVLASCAVGIAVDQLTDWTSKLRGNVYLGYDANRMTVGPHWRMRNLTDTPCPHFPSDLVGTPIFKTL